MQNSQSIKRVTYTGVFAALIFLATLLHVPVGSHGGYIHFGDSLIYLAACVLPLPYAMAASAIGAGLSDIMSPGGIVWLLPTAIIKPLCCLAFTRTRATLLNRRNIAALFAGGAITIGGYYLAAAVIIGSPFIALAEIPGFLIQSVGSGLCYLLWAGTLDKTGLRHRLVEL